MLEWMFASPDYTVILLQGTVTATFPEDMAQLTMDSFS